jgi:hypothetical protein
VTEPTPAFPVSPSPRREFLAQVATAAAALAATACVSGNLALGTGTGSAQPTPPSLPALPPLPPLEFDDTWTARVTGRYRAVFDSPDIDDGTAIFNAYSFMQGFKDMYKLADADVSAVIVFRHRAIPVAFDDAVWDRYGLGEYAKVKDPVTKTWARRNPFWKAPPGDKEGAEYALDVLQHRGTIVLGCALATHGLAGILAERTRLKTDAVFDDLRRHLLPGAQLQPSGIFAVMRAEEAGCHYMRST